MKPFCRLVTLGLLVLLAACRQQQLSTSDIRLALSASGRLVGETTLLVAVSDSAGDPIANPGTLRVRGDMDHAGMAPVLAESDSAADGVFTLPFEWTMGGSWIVEASLELANGAVASETFRYEILSEATDAEHSKMQPDDMPGMNGESSAVYMRISNRGEEDIVIVSASSAAAEAIAFHHTVVENDMARMKALDGLRIRAGETIELAPGGAHIMLADLKGDLLPGSRLSLRLHCDTGEVYDLDISVSEMLMAEPEDAVQFGNLVFSDRWARPARAAMDMSN